MSVINTNQFPASFSAPSVLPEFEQSPSGAQYGAAQGYPQASDAISPGFTLPIAYPNPGLIGYAGSQGQSSGLPSGGWSFGSILNQIGSLINGLFQQLGSMLGSGTSTPITTPISQSSETYYSNATADSVGDPHLSFDGTTGAGTNADDKWNSMTSHANLLSSDSFQGGYQVSTTATPENAKGIAYNASATVTADGGAATITMNGDGSYTVNDDGQNLSLQTGQATQLGGGETVTLNADGSLSINDQNGQGGSITTTLSQNGHGVDVKNTATNADLTGFLVNQSDNDASPIASGNGLNAPYAYAGQSEPYAYVENPYEQNPYEYEGLTSAQPMVTGLEEFDPDADATSLQNIELG